MTEDYKRGLIAGLAMQPLCVVAGSESSHIQLDNYCAPAAFVGEIISNDGFCQMINYEEE